MKAGLLIGFLLLLSSATWAQFSPGDLSEAHRTLEGLTNCTECHSIGSKIDQRKCLDCHDQLDTRISMKKGFHVSKEVKGKSCISCHSEHHGRKFDAIRLDEKKFDHDLTGYPLEGGHQKIECRDCHKAEYIADATLKKNAKTFLGLTEDCLSCHEDYHEGTLKETCLDCHGMKSFETAPKFDHDKSKFPLKGAHQEVSCIECHQVTKRGAKKFQKFTGLKFGACVDCHQDPHENKFGLDCKKCHNENSWNKLNASTIFDHNKTGYPLEGEHQQVDCKACHISGYKKNLAFENCTDCHQDYHEGEFDSEKEPIRDCDACHSLQKPFSWSSYGLEEHQRANYPLTGAHEAVSCLACHKPNQDQRWDFKIAPHDCISCHANIHEGYLRDEFMPNADCQACHSTESWTAVTFDHTQTAFKLEAAHADVNCKACHFKSQRDSNGRPVQAFLNLDQKCVACHDDIHQAQFKIGEENDCARCHSTAKDWPIPLFDHQKSKFPLEGKHAEIECNMCHKSNRNNLPDNVILYKINPYRCIDCHGS